MKAMTLNCSFLLISRKLFISPHREDKLSRGKKVSSAKDARKCELAEKLARMKADAGASAPVPQVTPIGPSAPSDAPGIQYTQCSICSQRN